MATNCTAQKHIEQDTLDFDSPHHDHDLVRLGQLNLLGNESQPARRLP